MADDNITITLKDRQVVGKGLSKLRGQGVVPAVIHNHGKDSMHVQGDYVALDKAYLRAGKHHPVQLRIGDKNRLAMIKDVDYEPTKHRLRHVVFQAIKQNEKVSAEVPVVLEGEEIPAEKKGLLVLPQIDTVEVEAFPKDLPDELRVDATVLEKDGDRLHVSDIKVPQGVTILTDGELGIAVVETPRDQVAEADAALEEQKAADGFIEETDESAESAPADNKSADSSEEQ